MDKYKNKYRIATTRLQNWDYASAALYFITLNTKNRKHFFGEIINGAMVLSDLGLKTHYEWNRSLEMRPDMNLTLGEFIVMPDHCHGIIGIGDVSERDAKHRVSAVHNNTNTFGAQSKNLAAIIRGFKSSVTTYAKTNNIEFGWQPRFHDHIIRDYGEYVRITNYIRNNPINWPLKTDEI